LDGTKRWNGPISAAIYVKSSTSIRDLVDFVRANKRTFRHTTFHLFFEKTTVARDKLYPHNYLRNLAMNYINTDYFIGTDMDFVLNEGSYDGLVHLIQTDRQVRGRLDNRTMLVLPAFENSDHAEHEDLSLAPIEKAELVKQVKTTKKAEAFHLSKYRPGHGATNFEKWFANKTKAVYDISYERGFEPYALGRKTESLPQFWTAFRGFGMNKRSWYEELHRAGYRYGVLRDFFVFHIGKSSTTVSVSQWVVREYEKKFASYLDNRYPGQG
jgi:glycosyltransferase-like protein LARGE